MFWGIRTARFLSMLALVVGSPSHGADEERGFLLRGLPQYAAIIQERLERRAEGGAWVLYPVDDAWKEVTSGRFLIGGGHDLMKALRREFGETIAADDISDLEETLKSFHDTAPNPRTFDKFDETGLQYLRANFLSTSEKRLVRRFAGVLYLASMLDAVRGITLPLIHARFSAAFDGKGKEEILRAPLEAVACDLIAIRYSHIPLSQALVSLERPDWISLKLLEVTQNLGLSLDRTFTEGLQANCAEETAHQKRP